MNWEIEQAKNGQITLRVDEYLLYSKYDPINDATKFIESEIDPLMSNYLLIGVGLGYHLEALLKMTKDQTTYVYSINQNEEKLFHKYGNIDLLNHERVMFIDMEEIPAILLNNKTQVIVPLPWVKVMEDRHPLFDVLQDIKTRQMSQDKSNHELFENFRLNLTNNDPSINHYEKHFKNKSACLVSAGPSLNKSIDLLKEISTDYFVISVGSALKVLLAEKIEPDAVIITDPSLNVIKQIEGTHFTGPLFYLSTANHRMTTSYYNNRFIIYQKGFSEAENYVIDKEIPLLETGGSVATTAVSLLEFMGFQEIYLFGQDLGFKEGITHATGSTSGVSVAKKNRFRTVLANNGEQIYTTPNLRSYHRWFEKKAKQTYMKIYNTSLNGAEIEGVPFIGKVEVLSKLENKKWGKY